MKRISILFVCMGNICRSPLAEGIFLHLVGRQHGIEGFDVDSAGTGGWHEGEPPDRRSIAVARGHGLDISNQRARKIRRDDFDRFDVIVAMDRNNLAELTKTAPPGARERIHLFSSLAQGTIEDVPDPYYGDMDAFEAVYSMLFAGCSRLAEGIGKTWPSFSGNTSSVK
ncbi:low molecular weight protein-tyrosine-phosphatase [Rhizobium sp. BK251]|uniref:low molecular weight protein-tyrosine-phosphatase n=1 Tax=Rhizobium sp. BK251 TaxID=2512125 RepID=UPI0010499290|nr:low molecular weight protein-tyrosine-phosphatase [Rhizobium sp. BK251]TCL72796.1 protein-tyrosine phosphatase [Rhizobium sp. BK251]